MMQVEERSVEVIDGQAKSGFDSSFVDDKLGLKQ